ncbi:MAG: ATP-binding protein [Saprospiraceae bacterium]
MVEPYHITTHQVSQLTAEEIKKGFIVRTHLLNRILNKINANNRTDSIQHYVLVGSAGSGKSSMLNRIKVEYQESDQFIAIYLPEEQAGLYRLFDIWLAIIDELAAQGYDINRPEINTSQEDFSYLSKTGYDIINTFLQKENKQIILLLDNIDRVFKNIDDDKVLLRELLQNHKDLIIIGGSTEMSEDFWDYGDPFYQFFKIIRLEDLTKEEVNELFKHWSEVNDLTEIKDILRDNPGKVEAIRQMTGGNPRTMIMFIRLLVDNRHAQGFEYLKDIIDKTTSIYQERLQQLTPQQRKIVAELASIWQPATVEQLVQTCLMPSSLISAQLNKLQKARIVEAQKPKKGKTVYRLKERLFNLYLLMTQAGTREKKRARYLTDFLEVWYDGEEQNSQDFEKVSDIANDSTVSYSSKENLFGDQIFIHYLANDKIVASKMIKSLKNEDISNPLMNIYDLWLGNFDMYQHQRELISYKLMASNHAGTYLKESLVHYQYDWIIQLFDKNIELKQKFEPIYFAALMLKDSNLDLNLIVPEPMLESVLDVIKYAMVMQGFYYGK